MKKESILLKKVLPVLLLGTNVILLSSCNVGDSTTSAKTVQSKDQNKVRSRLTSSPLTNIGILGAPFHSNGDMGGTPDTDGQSCVNLDNFNFAINTGGDGVKVNSNVEYSMDKASTLSQLTVNVNAKASYGLFSAYANSNVDNSSDVEDNQIRFVYHYNLSVPVIITPKVSVGRDMGKLLDPDAYQSYKAGETNNNYSTFISQCGTRYVNQFTVGEALKYEFVLSFRDTTQKNLFALEAGMSYGTMAELSSKIQTFNSTHNSNIRINISATATGVKGEMPIPPIPSSCFSTESMGQCSTDIVASANTYTQANFKDIKDMATWLANNTDKPYFEKIAQLQGMKGIANTGNYLDYSRAYNNSIDLETNKDLLVLQQKIYNSIADMSSHIKLVDNVVPILSEWGVGDGDEKFKNNLTQLRKQKAKINQFADDIAAQLSSANSSLAKKCFRDNAVTCQSYFDSYFADVLNNVSRAYDFIDKKIAGNYFYTKNKVNDSFSDFGYLGLNTLGENTLFPIIINNNMNNNLNSYTRFYAPIMESNTNKPLLKTYLNLGGLSYPVKVISHDFDNSFDPSIELYISSLGKIDLSCKKISDRQANNIVDCSAGVLNKTLAELGLTQDSAISKLYLDPEAFIFYVPEDKSNIIQLFNNVFNATLGRSNYHDFLISSNPSSFDMNRISSQSVVLATNTKWFSPNKQYYLILSPFNNAGVIDGYTLSIKNVNDTRNIKTYRIKTNSYIPYMVLNLRPQSGLSDRYYVDLRFYNSANNMISQKSISVLIDDNTDNLNNLALMVGDDGNLYVVNKQDAFTGNPTTGYTLNKLPDYNSFMDYLNGADTPYSMKKINIAPNIFKG